MDALKRQADQAYRYADHVADCIRLGELITTRARPAFKSEEDFMAGMITASLRLYVGRTIAEKSDKNVVKDRLLKAISDNYDIWYNRGLYRNEEK